MSGSRKGKGSYGYVQIKDKVYAYLSRDDEASFERGRIKDRQLLSFRKQDWKILE